MKIRNGFVTNSSSTNFIIISKKEITIQFLFDKLGFKRGTPFEEIGWELCSNIFNRPDEETLNLEDISRDFGTKTANKWKDLTQKGYYSLRGHTEIKGMPITELIYIHSKLMIIDDRKVLIGSANINDRSMLGTRDSEYAVIVKEEVKCPSIMNGKNFKCAKFAASFRKALMAEHMGLKPDDPILIDPLSDLFLGRIKTTAKNNTILYRDIFGCYPDDTYTTFAKLREWKKPTTPEEIKELQFKYNNKKESIIGHIVEFPLDFLKDEKLGINFFSVENLVPEKNFT